MNPSLEEARILLHKSGDDKNAAEALAKSPSAASRIGGFHAQQAIEKALKAVLASKNILYARTRNLTMLVALLAKNGISAAGSPSDHALLTPFGAALRYDDTTDSRSSHVKCFRRACPCRDTLAWAEKQFETGGKRCAPLS